MQLRKSKVESYFLSSMHYLSLLPLRPKFLLDLSFPVTFMLILKEYKEEFNSLSQSNTQ